MLQMKGNTVWASLVLHVGGVLANSHSLSLISNVTHMHGYEADSPFEHVNGSACCLDFAIQVDAPETCKSLCMEREACGSFIFAPDESQCYLISQESNFDPVDSPRSCERRCAKREACEAFVFTPSSRLCFLIRFEGNGTALKALVKPASDRIFGLVRERSTGKLQIVDGGSNGSAPVPNTDASETHSTSFKVTEIPLTHAVGNVENPVHQLQDSKTILRKHEKQKERNSRAQMSRITGMEASYVQGTVAGADGSDASISGSTVLPAFLGVLIAWVAVAALVSLLVRAGFAIPLPDTFLQLVGSNAHRRSKLGSPTLPAPSVRRPVPAAAGEASLVDPKDTKEKAAENEAMPTSPVSKAEKHSPVSAEKTAAPIAKNTLGLSLPVAKASSQKLNSEAGDVAGSDGQPHDDSVSVVTPRMAVKADFTWRDKETLVPVRHRCVDVAGPTNYPVFGETSSHARAAPVELKMKEVVDAEGSADSEEDSDARDEEQVELTPRTLHSWLPEIVLLVCATLLGVLRFEARAFVTIAFASLCVAIPLGLHHWTELRNVFHLVFHLVVHGSTKNVVAMHSTDNVQPRVLSGSSLEEKSRARAREIARERAKRLHASMPTNGMSRDFQTGQGGG